MNGSKKSIAILMIYTLCTIASLQANRNNDSGTTGSCKASAGSIEAIAYQEGRSDEEHGKPEHTYIRTRKSIAYRQGRAAMREQLGRDFEDEASKQKALMRRRVLEKQTSSYNTWYSHGPMYDNNQNIPGR